MEKLIQILTQNPELALAVAMVLGTEREDVYKAYLDVLPVDYSSSYEQQAIFPKQYRMLVAELKDIASTGIAKRKRVLVPKAEL